MGRFAWRNLLTRPLRTALALIGLSVPILGVLGLFSVSQGLRNMVGDTLSQVEGVMVIRENTPSPVFSKLPADLAAEDPRGPRRAGRRPRGLGDRPERRGEGVHDRRWLTGKSMAAVDPRPAGDPGAGHRGPRRCSRAPSSPGPSKEGRFLKPSDQGKPNIVISRKIARDYPGADGKPRKVGDTLQIGGKPFQIVGIYETGSMLLDVVIVMDIDTARKLLETSRGRRSRASTSRPPNPSTNDAVAAAIEKAMPGRRRPEHDRVHRPTSAR